MVKKRRWSGKEFQILSVRLTDTGWLNSTTEDRRELKFDVRIPNASDFRVPISMSRGQRSKLEDFTKLRHIMRHN